MWRQEKHFNCKTVFIRKQMSKVNVNIANVLLYSKLNMLHLNKMHILRWKKYQYTRIRL